MSEMKYSGIKWIGNIPEEWNISKYKYFSESRMGETILSEDTVEKGIPVYSATESNDVFGYVNNSKLLLHKNDFVIPARGNSVGFITIVSDDKATCTQTTICSRNIHDINYKYLFYSGIAYKNDWFRYDGSAIPQITVSQINNNKLVIPSIKEQKLIADFLDEKVNIIDNIICDLDNQIEILGKYKKQLISEIVTRGLNKKKAMKDSGIEWIGSIPEHWKIKRMKYICKKITDGSHFSPETQLSGKKYITVSDVYNDKIHIENAKFITEDDFKLLVKNGCRPSINDVLLSKDGTVGRSAIVDTNDFVVLSSLGILTPSNLMYGKYLKYMLDSEMLQEQMKMSTDGSALKRITISKISNFIGIIPSLAEQREIVDYLDKKCSEIEEILNSKMKQKEQMEQYKKSVIYEYVTGKKRVEGAEELYG